MANYCFRENEGRRALFKEVFVRAWIAGLGDFPRFKSQQEAGVQSFTVANTLRSEACCIHDDDNEKYYGLVAHAWSGAYFNIAQSSEREVFRLACDIKGKPEEEARAIIHHRLATTPAGSDVANFYATYCAT